MAHSLRFHLPHGEGEFSRQAHVAPPHSTFERELGAEGFEGPATMMYHRNPPTAWSGINGPLRPRAFDLKTTRPSRARVDARPVMHSDVMKMRYWVFSETDGRLFRNSDGDDLIFVHHGEGDFFCDYGHLTYRSGDYIVIPRGTMWRIETKVPNEFLLVEATDCAYAMPDRGLLGPHALFDPGMLDRPKLDSAFTNQTRGGAWRLIVKRHEQLTTIDYAFNPLDAVGWQGNRSVLRLNITDFRPVNADGYHVPPSATVTFTANRFLVCTLPPTVTATDPPAMKIPFWHNNDDYDEVVFMHRGFPGGHQDLGEGTMTLAPSGLTHGVYPQHMEYMFNSPVVKSNHYAVLIDSRAAVHVDPGLADGEFGEYANAWRDALAYAPDAPQPERQAAKVIAFKPAE
ncbi:MAG: hmgA [Caulobacteraceae bacterium]|nr:hmgA [Caulobacteraceae bacterium]